MANLNCTYFNSPLGILEIKATAAAIVAVKFIDEMPDDQESASPILNECCHQLEQYFNGRRKKFDLKMVLTGTPFQLQVWNQIILIKHGKTKSYLELAKEIENVKVSRAIGSAVAKNNLLLLIPCHRVIGNNGDLVGYSGGLWRKNWLLDFEKSFHPNYQAKIFTGK